MIDPDRVPKEGDIVVLYGEVRVAGYAGEPGIMHAVVGSAARS